MNKHIIQGNWKQIKGEAKILWGRLTDDDMDEVEGRRDILAGKIQERYGLSMDEAHRQVDDWEKSLKD